MNTQIIQLEDTKLEVNNLNFHYGDFHALKISICVLRNTK